MAFIFGTTGDDQLTGTANDDIIFGKVGDDTIRGKEGNDVIYGEAGDDTLYGGAGRDTLYGGDGNDVLYGGKGADILDGGIGDDIIYGGDGNDIIYGSAGIDYIHGDAGSNLLTYEESNVSATIFMQGDLGQKDALYQAPTNIAYTQNVGTVKGSNFADTIYGSDGDDIIYGLGGSDTIYGYDEISYWSSGSISDLLGNDTIHGGEGNNYIYIGLGNNTITLGDGNNSINQDPHYIGAEYIQYANMLFGKTNITAGNGNTGVNLSYAYNGSNITAGDGDNYVNINTHLPYEMNINKISYGVHNITLGNGNNNVNIDNAHGGAQVETGDGNDSVSIRHHVNAEDPEQWNNSTSYLDLGNGDNQISIAFTANGHNYITTGDGEDTISIRDKLIHWAFGDDLELVEHQSYASIDSGAGNDDIYVQVGIADIDAGDGNDKINLEYTHSSNINLGAGDDTISLTCWNNNVDAGAGDDVISMYAGYFGDEGLPSFSNTLIGGDGSDRYELSMYEWCDLSYIINNYDTDGGYDILNISYWKDVSALWEGDDLVITSEYADNATGKTYTTTVTVVDYRLGSDYQIDEFNMGYNDSYTGDEFLAAMGLTL